MYIDKKCLKCPIRKFSVKAVHILRYMYELEQVILDCMDDFDTNINNYREVEKGVITKK